MVEQLENLLEKYNIFLTGGAGTGKSYTTRRLMERYGKRGRKVIALGSTGISAVNIGGHTVHSFFVFGISSDLDELIGFDRRNRKRVDNLKHILRSVDLIIIDEISMISADLMDMIYYRLEQAGYNGKVMFVGDFFQMPPVARQKKSSSLFGGALYAFESSGWEAISPRTVELKEVRRTRDAEFIEILSRIRRGAVEKEEVTSYLETLAAQEYVKRMDPTYLFGRNAEVDMMNKEGLRCLDAREIHIEGDLDILQKRDERRYEKWIDLLPVPRTLVIKAGAPVLFTVNKWGRYYNGEKGVVLEADDEHMVIEKGGESIEIERHTFELTEPEIDRNGELGIKTIASFSQFPVRLSYAVTIHKSQGMSLESMVCNIDSIFLPSQFYVAVSRATDPRRLKIDFSGGDIGGYIKRVARVDERVEKYYAETKG